MHTDYAGDSPYLDGSLSDPGGSGSFIVTGQSRYFGGSGQQTLDPQGTGNVLSRRYFHGDLIDSNVMTTDQAGAAVATTAYTAFGETISWHAGAASPSLPDDPETLGTRYQYAGQWGYEAPTNIDYTGGGGGGGSGTAPYSEGPGLTLRGVNPTLPPITLSHVGARWYQPGVGRFVQRDPIGLRGGRNSYAYCSKNTMVSVDPHGLWTIAIGIGLGIDFGIPLSPGWVSGSGQGFICFDDNGRIGIGITGGLGPGVGLYGGAGGLVTGTNADSIEDLRGPGWQGGVDTPAGSLDVVGGSSYRGLCVGIGPGVGVGANGQATGTAILTWDDVLWAFTPKSGAPQGFRPY